MAFSHSFLLLLTAAVLYVCKAALVNEYDHFAALDPDEKFKLYWTINGDEVSFAVDGATTGWVGFGISTGQGKMDKADMVIGWVKDGKAYLSDRHGVGHNPKIDDHNDYRLISGVESNGRTVIKFSRKIDTCDSQDIKLQEGTTKVIFALNDQDPESEESVMQHTFRNVRSILLLNSQGNRNEPDPTWKHFDVLNNKFKVPSKHTFYHCSVQKIPDFKDKQHIVRFDPVVERGNEGIVHHFIVVLCDQSFPGEKHANISMDCQDYQNMPADFAKCYGFGMLAAAWGIGGGPFVYPNHVGFPIDADFAGRHFIMEVHYDNPGQKPGFVDSSGVRFFYTDKLRQYDAGVMSVGSSVSSWMMVPPKQKAWKTTGYCRKQCTEEALKNSSLPEKGVKMFSAFLHTHLAGVATWTKHVRDGVELPEVARDNNYDFNFQDIQFLPKEIHFKPGDDLVHTCIYNTMDRKNLTNGGISTRQEMCLNFIFYYPLIPTLSSCTSIDLQAGAAMTDKYFPELNAKNQSIYWNMITTSNKTWTDEMTADYRKMLDDQYGYYVRFPYCNNKVKKRPFKEAIKDQYQIPVVKITKPLPEPTDNCNVISSAVKLTGLVMAQLIGLTVALMFV